MIYKLPVTIKLYDREYIARCEPLRATATGDTPDEALKNLREAIDEMINRLMRNDHIFYEFKTVISSSCCIDNRHCYTSKCT